MEMKAKLQTSNLRLQGMLKIQLEETPEQSIDALVRERRSLVIDVWSFPEAWMLRFDDLSALRCGKGGPP
jgi:hypothetical protein